METATSENGDVQRLQVPRTIDLSYETPPRIAGIAHKTRTAVADKLEPIRFNHSGKSNRSLYQDLGITMERIQEDTYRPQMPEFYEALSKYLQGKNAALNPLSASDVHQYLIECHAALGKFLRKRQNGEARNMPLKALLRTKSSQVFMNSAAE